MVQWLRAHDTLLMWLVIASILTFIASIAAVAWVIVRVPPDYFTRTKPEHGPWANRHPLIRLLLVGAKNFLGLVLVIAGILMLVLPGQGVLTILAGIVLLDIPGKHHLLLWLIGRPAVFKSLNWVRTRAGREPFVGVSPAA